MAVYTIKSSNARTFNDGGRRLCRDSNGNLHTVVVAYDGSSIEQIYYLKSTDGGANWTETALTASSYSQEDCYMCIDSNDVIHVVWVGKFDGTGIYKLYYRKYNGAYRDWETT